ncbi:MAG: GTA-gp10 family protein [Pseudomonadota bacterium]
MTANGYRGEVFLTLENKPYTLVLTLDALARLEALFETNDLSALIARLCTVRAEQIGPVLIEAMVAGSCVERGQAVKLLELGASPATLARAYADLIRATFGAS